MVTGAATLTDVLSFKGPQEAPVAHCPPGKNPATKVLAKANALRKWLSVGTDGEASILELAKLRVTHQLGVQLRDLRLLDPQLAASYPSAILAREHALVVNLEFIKCIVTMEHVYITSLEDPNTLAFVEELQRRLASMEREQLLQRTSLRGSVAGTPFDVPVTLSGGADGELGELAGMSPRTRRSASSASTDSSIVDEEVAAVEMLLEPYFMQVDNTYNKLQTLCEYIDDTEDYINIELDSHRNELIRLDLVLTALTASVALITAITSLFAMNLELSPGVQGQASREGPYWQFIVVSVVCCLAAAFIFTGVMVYCRWKRLI
ncbi:Magnesium transporter MRS2-I [Auxenochlorella protothecoides]|uniref:Magnesium transporter n=1 Tax=Auxenochlorella protothecoides TaxID=3075 RepID=A0A087SRD4_AUXPR|nr:Magnesium transporter MRS2-I [Auxenochlorella protothecoides]KFM28288.1 Magnesium transporter MRS2-I [Auxenochlorella protothecoides]